MCGRFFINEEAFDDAAQIAEIPAWIQGELHFGDIYPSRPSLILEKAGDHFQGAVADFGYFSESMNKRIINARAETAAEKYMFRKAWKTSRCVVVAARFYEWDADKQKIGFKLPHTMYLGALKLGNDFVILTEEANDSMKPYHHRMPVVFTAQQAKAWVMDEPESGELWKQASPDFDALLPPSQPALF